jgi:uncharacterized protein (TIGR02569 family)
MQPSPDVLLAFQVVGAPTKLNGGTGRAWAAAGAVLKPVDDELEAAWIADLALRVGQRGFRLARPIRAVDGRVVVDGWCAWTRIEGRHQEDRWADVLGAGAAFHRAVAAEERPPFISRKSNRWRVADRVAWGELPLDGYEETAHVARLAAARRPIDVPSQLIHGDLAGNVLFADPLPPGIIDLSLYWRPAGYAAALVVGEAITWEDASSDLLGVLEPMVEWRQLLVRAALFHVIVSELARREDPTRRDAAEHYVPLVDLVLSLANR